MRAERRCQTCKYCGNKCLNPYNYKFADINGEPVSTGLFKPDKLYTSCRLHVFSKEGLKNKNNWSFNLTGGKQIDDKQR